MAHFAHRFVAAIVGVILAVTTVVVWRAVATVTHGDPPVPGAASMLGLVGTAATLFVIQVIVGALQIWTTLAPWAVTLHLALGAAIWALLVAGRAGRLVRRARRAYRDHDRWAGPSRPEDPCSTGGRAAAAARHAARTACARTSR